MSQRGIQEADYWIDKLQLKPHPEGGFYRESYRSSLILSQSALPSGFSGDRSASTAIFFLLQGEDFSGFHRIASDEMWHFYAGGALSVHVIDPEGGRHIEIQLGRTAERGDVFQAIVPAGCWFASCPRERDSFALVGCTVSPGFDFAEFEMADRSALTKLYPQHRALIERLTREPSSPARN